MEAPLSLEDLDWLQKLVTDTPDKPDVPKTVHKRLVDAGYAMELVEGGLQLTDLGRKRLENASPV
jgi:hypothetical protein